jgi:hypothetical protein
LVNGKEIATVFTFLKIVKVKPGKAPTTHNERVGVLLTVGWKYDDVIHALEASKNENGELLLK